MNFPLQTELQSQLPKVRELYKRRGFDVTRIENLAPLIENFEIRVPFIGPFSSGKTSLINALIEEWLLSTEVTPETAVPAEIRYGERHFVGHTVEGRSISLSADDIHQNRLSALTKGGWLEITLPAPFLAEIPHLVLVDMPGFGSGIETHDLAISGYVTRSLAYVIVVPVEDGTLHESVRRALSELAVWEKPLVLVINKADKRAEAPEIAKRIAEEVTSLINHPPLAVALTSATKLDVAQLKNALKTLELQAGDVFRASVARPWMGALEIAAQQLRRLASQEFASIEQIDAEIATLQAEMAKFDAELARQTAEFEERTGQILATIRLRMENALAARLEVLVDRAAAGLDIRDDILATVRLLLSQALKEEFDPAVRRYVERAIDALPSELQIELDLNFLSSGKNSANEETSAAWLLGLTPLMERLIAEIPHPIGKIAAAAAAIILGFFASKATRQRQEIDAAEQKERIRTQVRAAIPQAIDQIDAGLRPELIARIKNAKAAVAKEAESRRAELARTLAAKREALAQETARQDALRREAQADLELVEDMMRAISSELES